MSTLRKPPVTFSKKDPAKFFRTIHTQVNEYFKTNGLAKTGNMELYIKCIFMYALYLVPLILIFTPWVSGWGIVLCYALMGMGAAGVGLCVMHDAIHGTFSRHKLVNQIMGYSMNMVGGSDFTWKIQHNVLHHGYTNIYGLDEDIHDKAFLRLSPSGKLKSYHRFQHVYAFLLYSLATISWVLKKDFVQLREYTEMGLTEKHGFNPKKEFWVMLGTKIVYVFILLVLPLLAGLPVGWVVAGFLLKHLISGLYVTIIFQLAHVVEGPQHHDTPQTGTMENTWAIHQLSTTANFACKNRLVTWMVGGLNYQIEHHLFPYISHVHYREIAKIVKKAAADCNLPYHEFKHFRQAVASHVRVLRQLGHGLAV
ncbi:MAG: acyl-CoA desaturase [Bacteroidota bacterium]